MRPTYQEKCRSIAERCSNICESLEEAIEDAKVYKVATLAEQLVSEARDLDHFASEWDEVARKELD